MTYRIFKMGALYSFLLSSGLRLDGLQVDEDASQHLVAQDALPDGHPLLEAPLAHRFAEYLGRLPPVTERQSTQVERPLSLNRVRSVAMRAETLARRLHSFDAE